MRIKKTNTILGTALLLGGSLFLYLYLDTAQNTLYNNPEAQKLELKSIEAKLKLLETDLELNSNIMSDIKDAVKEILDKDKGGPHNSRSKQGHTQAGGGFAVNKTLATVNRLDTLFAQKPPSKCNIEMDKVYDQLSFDNPDGGVWKQGWDIRYDPNSWTKKKLRVFVVPHSHNDPGWIKTFEKYYADQTNKILTLIVKKLKQFPSMKFIWAEISYLAMWWQEQNTQMKRDFQSLLDEERLEIVTGGWVMPDEANSHYTAMLEQLIFGHEWCQQNLNGYKPNSGWSIDPFGMSPTMAYILKRSGLDNMLIQRTHYSIKKKLAQEKSLEFMWRQHWDHNSTSDMFCHMMPFYSYDVPHTCGPDPKICCQFDFLRLPGGRVTCPWNVPPRKITPSNVAERSLTLLDQYRKKSQLYKTNVVLAPLGDDFRWDGDREWNDQSENYQRIMDYVNAHPEMGAEIHWGTLSDYFKAVREDSKAATGEETGLFPSLSGDFFTYADRDDHYWSGYFTSRPFWKNMDRILEGYLRAGEILFSQAWAEMEFIGADKPEMAKECVQKLVYARKSLSLFQHHDGITGTAKDHVVLDYGSKMLNSIRALQFVIHQSANFLLTKDKPNYKPRTDTAYFDMDDTREASWDIPKKSLVSVESGGTVRRVVLYNSQARIRRELVTIRVSTHRVKVYTVVMLEETEEDEAVDCQISPVFNSEGEILNTEYELTFLATVPALGLETYHIRELVQGEEEEEEAPAPATVRIFNSDKQQLFQVAPFSSVTVSERGEEFSLRGVHISAQFSREGLLQSVTTLDDRVTTPVSLEFVEYGTRSRGERSGAYLFLPDGPGRQLQLANPLVRVVEGNIRSYVEVVTPWNVHRAIINRSPGVDGTGIAIENDINLTNANRNTEISMRFSTGVESEQTFFTDLNGFQMIKRTRYEKLPLQANFYPLPSLSYIQDSRTRVSLVSGQPLGGASLASGQLEVMLDRKLLQDDNRGLFQGVQDNKVTRHQFYLLVERRDPTCVQEPDTQASYPSLVSHSVRHSLLHPLYRLIYPAGSTQGHTLKRSYTAVEKNLDCDIQVINLRTMLHNADSMTPSDRAALILHRQGFNSCYKPVGLTCSTNTGKVSLDELFPTLYSSSVHQMSLSLMYDGMKMEKSFTVSIQPMEMYSFILTR